VAHQCNSTFVESSWHHVKRSTNSLTVACIPYHRPEHVFGQSPSVSIPSPTRRLTPPVYLCVLGERRSCRDNIIGVLHSFTELLALVALHYTPGRTNEATYRLKPPGPAVIKRFDPTRPGPVRFSSVRLLGAKSTVCPFVRRSKVPPSRPQSPPAARQPTEQHSIPFH
jgi:hypothetical protein